MFISRYAIEAELKEEEDWGLLTPKQRQMFLNFCTNGMDEVKAYEEAYSAPDGLVTVKFPAKKASQIVATEQWRNCYDIFGEMIRELATMNTNIQLYQMYSAMANYSIFDFIDKDGAFKYDNMDHAKEILGIKAYALKGLDIKMHPKDVDATIVTPVFVDRQKAMDKLAQYTKFLGSEEAGGNGIGHISIQTGNAEFKASDDAMLRKKYGLEIVK